MQKPLLELTSSKIFTILLVFLYLFAIFCIGFSRAPFVLQILLMSLCVVSFITTMRRDTLLRSPKSIMQAKAIEGQQWKIMQRNGQQHIVRLLGKSICTRWLVILNFEVLPQIFNSQQIADLNSDEDSCQISDGITCVEKINDGQIKNEQINNSQIKEEQLIDSQKLNELLSGKSMRREQMMKASENDEGADLMSASSYCDRVKKIVTKIYHAQHGKLSVLIFPDSIDRNSFRQLRAYLQAVRGVLR